MYRPGELFLGRAMLPGTSSPGLALLVGVPQATMSPSATLRQGSSLECDLDVTQRSAGKEITLFSAPCHI